jgi:hypothetical protein
MTWYELYKSPIRSFSQITKNGPVLIYMIKNNRCCQKVKGRAHDRQHQHRHATGLVADRQMQHVSGQRGKKQTAKRAHTGVGLNLMIFQQQSIVYLALSAYQSALHFNSLPTTCYSFPSHILT